MCLQVCPPCFYARWNSYHAEKHTKKNIFFIVLLISWKRGDVFFYEWCLRWQEQSLGDILRGGYFEEFHYLIKNRDPCESTQKNSSFDHDKSTRLFASHVRGVGFIWFCSLQIVSFFCKSFKKCMPLSISVSCLKILLSERLRTYENQYGKITQQQQNRA